MSTNKLNERAIRQKFEVFSDSNLSLKATIDMVFAQWTTSVGYTKPAPNTLCLHWWGEPERPFDSTQLPVPIVRHLTPMNAEQTLYLVSWWLATVPLDQREGDIASHLTITDYYPAFKATCVEWDKDHIMLTITAMRVYYGK